ncbi:hypothetical protein C2G38_2187672 [Gigaspora rosea]|uniref:Berberine/berberine-like domain-containing protein n=1 Tax=Gigaspora rosea TaxID=44941 RepID=A0A397V4C4_9GLOM|nr:hypothetical protein C2G38_2187672 [Gigaspora rosea]
MNSTAFIQKIILLAIKSRTIYQNYIDRDLPDWIIRYFGPHVPKLPEIKKKYDPNNLIK